MVSFVVSTKLAKAASAVVSAVLEVFGPLCLNDFRNFPKFEHIFEIHWLPPATSVFFFSILLLPA